LLALPARADESTLPSPPTQPNAASSQGPLAKLKVHTREIVVDPDGSATMTMHSELQVLKESIVAALSQQSLQYVESTQTLEVKEAYTLKADGRKLPVGPDAIITQQAPRTGTSPIYTDLKVRIVIFPDVEAGDTLVYSWVVHSKPVLPGQYANDTVIPPTLYIDTTTTSVSVPAALPLTIDSRDVTVKTTPYADHTVYEMQYSNVAPVSDDNQPLARFDRVPRFSVSSFKTYDALAVAYAALTEPKIVITPAIKAKADEITAEAKGERERVRKIYDWVSGHIRYVAVEFGLGSIVPHSADSVLANGYGDCKDHAVLFAALLRAKNIDSNLVLINGTNAYSVAKVPTLGAFNHMIAWIPDLNAYADTTARGLPFGYLSHAEYGKPVLRIGDKANPALQHTPVMKASQAVGKYVAADKLDAEAHVTGNNVTTGTGVLALSLRGLGGVLQLDPTSKFATEMLKARGMPRATGSYTAPSLTEPGDSYAISGSYQTPNPWQGVLQETGFRLPDGLHLLGMTSPILLGAIADDKYKSATSVPCFSGHVVEDYTLEAPPGMKAGSLPVDGRVKSEHFDFSSRWTSTAHGITVHREITVNFNDAICTGDVLQEARSTIARIRTDLNASVTLVRSP
jgi:transglutaminase-like putative cysteine protease